MCLDLKFPINNLILKILKTIEARLLYLWRIIHNVDEILEKLEDKLNFACKKCNSDTIALSGGLDSTILAYMLKDSKPHAVSVAAKDFQGTDLVFCQIAAKKFDLPLTIIKADTPSLMEAIEGTISILKNFNDIEIRNNIVIYLAIKWAKEHGSKNIVTGDGADELFAGYNFLLGKTDSELQKELGRIYSIMHFPSKKIGTALGVQVLSPYLEESFKKFAFEIPAQLKVKEEGGSKFGKWVLRKAFEQKISPQIAWRQKSPMQDGSGTNQLTELFNNIISDEVYLKKQKNVKVEFNVSLRSKESMYYFEIFNKLFTIAQEQDKDNSCPFCHYNTENSKFCRMCGAFPI